MSFSFSFVANEKRKKRTKRKRKHATASYALTSVVQMDVASRACTFSLAIAPNRCTLAARLSFIWWKLSWTGVLPWGRVLKAGEGVINFFLLVLFSFIAKKEVRVRIISPPFNRTQKTTFDYNKYRI